MRRPTETFGAAVEWLGLPRDDDALARAIAASSFSTVRDYELRHGAIHGAIGQLHTRSGRIGEWRDHLDEKDLARVRSILAEYGLDLDTFETE